MTNRPEPVSDRRQMIAGMTPALLPGRYAFASVGDPARAAALIPEALGMFREDEGLSLILEAGIAAREGFDPGTVMRAIRLNVYSALEGVGLTAAVADALATAGIACNMVAAYHHDTAFVPVARAEEAMAVLIRLQRAAAAT